MNTLFVYNPDNFRVASPSVQKYRDYYKNSRFKVGNAVVSYIASKKNAAQFFKDKKPISLQYTIIDERGICYAVFDVEVKPDNFIGCLLGDIHVGNLKREVSFDDAEDAPTDYDILNTIVAWMATLGCLQIEGELMNLEAAS